MPPTHSGPALTPAQAEAHATTHQHQLTSLLPTTPSGPPRGGQCRWHAGTTAGMTSTDRETIAWILADAVVKTRTGANHSYQLWRNAALSGATLDEHDAKRVRPFLLPVFGLPTQPKDLGHVAGHVAEWLWFLHASELVDPTRHVLHLEPPKNHVTAPGPDGFVVYSTANQQTVFRLWEIKKHDSTAAVTTVVAGATSQLNDLGDQYLSQLTTVLSERHDDVGDLARELVDLWVDADPRAGAGIAITSSATPTPDTCFAGVGGDFPQFPQPGQLEGLLISVTDLQHLAIDVRSYLWTVL